MPVRVTRRGERAHAPVAEQVEGAAERCVGLGLAALEVEHPVVDVAHEMLPHVAVQQ